MLPEGEDLNEWVAVNSKSKHHPFDAVLEASFHSKIKIEASCFSCSCWFLQSNQHAVWHHHGVLHGRELSHHVSGTQVRIPLGRRSHGKETHQVFSTEIHRLPNDLGARSAGRWGSLSVKDRWLFNFPFVIFRLRGTFVKVEALIVSASRRCSFPQELSVDCQDHSETIIQSLCPYLSSALQRSRATWWRGASQYIVQAFYILRSGIQYSFFVSFFYEKIKKKNEV